MKIIDLVPEYKNQYFTCLEDWAEEMQDAKDHKACWYEKFKNKGLGVKLAQNDEGVVAGMIQYLPIEESFVGGHDLHFILCIWVHGHKNGIGNQQGNGMGQSLLAAAEGDCRARGAKGMAAWGMTLPVWMKASWFKRHGYVIAARDFISSLLWKPFSDDAQPPHWIKAKKEIPTLPDKLVVTAFHNGWCPVQNAVYERAKRAIQEFGDKVVFNEYDTSDRDVFSEWGISDGLFINKKQIGNGPSLSYEKIVKSIKKHIHNKTLCPARSTEPYSLSAPS